MYVCISWVQSVFRDARWIVYEEVTTRISLLESRSALFLQFWKIWLRLEALDLYNYAFKLHFLCVIK